MVFLDKNQFRTKKMRFIVKVNVSVIVQAPQFNVADNVYVLGATLAGYVILLLAGLNVQLGVGKVTETISPVGQAGA